MQENIAELSRKYREEMMRMYSAKQTTAPIREAAEVQPVSAPVASERAEQTTASAVSEQSEPAVPETEEEAPPANEAFSMPEADPEEVADTYEDPVLPEYMRIDPPQLPEDWKAQENYEKRNTAEGRLRVVAATARSAYPVAGARVMVYTRIGGKDYLNYVLTTDISGETPTVTLPAPPASLSQDPDNETPYAVCDIDIFATGFFHSEARNVHIFAGVTTRQEFQLVPLPLNFTSADQIEFNPEGHLEEVN